MNTFRVIRKERESDPNVAEQCEKGWTFYFGFQVKSAEAEKNQNSARLPSVLLQFFHRN